MFKKIAEWINHLFTDSADRPELKNIFGVSAFVCGIVKAFTSDNVQMVAMFFTLTLLLIFGITWENKAIDAGKIAVDLAKIKGEK